MIQLFVKGGLIMWPILLLSIVTLSVVVERIFFLLAENRSRNQASVSRIFQLVKQNQIEHVEQTFKDSADMVVRVLSNGLQHRDAAMSEAMLESASVELDRYNRGLVVLDTAITLGPLLGLLGTVIGMMEVFGIIAGGDLSGKEAVLTGGIAQCLIAVTFGLAVAIIAVVPLNYLNSRVEKARRQLESAMTGLELLMAKRHTMEV